MKPIIVIGDLNMDFVVQTPKLPVRGETIMGTNFRMVPGGKGANQAVAAGKLGKRVKMIGRVGKDIFGENLITGLSSVGVDTQLVLSTPEISTGIALILVEDGGQNQITVPPGANDALQPNDFKELFQHYQEGFLRNRLLSSSCQLVRTSKWKLHLTKVCEIRLLGQHRCLLLTYAQLFLHSLLALLYRNDLSVLGKIHLFLRAHAIHVHL